MTTPTPNSRRFVLVRSADHTGVSGTGEVADGVQFADGSCVLKWRGERSSTVVWPDLESVEIVHGHDGATTVEWVDDEDGEEIDPVGQRGEAMARAGSILRAADGSEPLGSGEVVALAEWLLHGFPPQRPVTSVNAESLHIAPRTDPTRYLRPF